MWTPCAPVREVCRPGRDHEFRGRRKPEVARYGQHCKDRVVARLLPPESDIASESSFHRVLRAHGQACPRT